MFLAVSNSKWYSIVYRGTFHFPANDVICISMNIQDSRLKHTPYKTVNTSSQELIRDMIGKTARYVIK